MVKILKRFSIYPFPGIFPSPENHKYTAIVRDRKPVAQSERTKTIRHTNISVNAFNTTPVNLYQKLAYMCDSLHKHCRTTTHNPFHLPSFAQVTLSPSILLSLRSVSYDAGQQATADDDTTE